MYKRSVESFVREISPKYPVITVIGPRQSGKSTLVRHVFANYEYVSLETPHERDLAENDPLSFFKKHAGSLILDEVQRVPNLLSYIQTFVDEPKNKSRYVLTGSQQLLLMEKITQSLAGRTVIIKLLPFSYHEMKQAQSELTLDEVLYSGGYPRIFDKNLNPTQWLQQYYQTYVERDVRSLVNVAQLDLFQRFVGLCAGRVGQLLNYASLGNDCGVSDPTAKSWLSILHTSFICFTLKPHFKNFNKRIIKSPKLYFYDTGLLCYLLKISTPRELENHPLRGFIFENFVIVEKLKSFLNQGIEPSFYFWRDSTGHECDLALDKGTLLYPSEIKSAMTFQSLFIKDLDYLNGLQKKALKTSPQGEVIYGGDESFDFKNYRVISWHEAGAK